MNNVNLSKEEILNRIGYFRTKRNISSYKLGLELGHSKTYFYRIESGEIQLTLDKLLEILEILQVSTTEFFCPSFDDNDQNFLKLLNELTEEKKQTILDLMEKLK